MTRVQSHICSAASMSSCSSFLITPPPPTPPHALGCSPPPPHRPSARFEVTYRLTGRKTPTIQSSSTKFDSIQFSSTQFKSVQSNNYLLYPGRFLLSETACPCFVHNILETKWRLSPTDVFVSFTSENTTLTWTETVSEEKPFTTRNVPAAVKHRDKAISGQLAIDEAVITVATSPHVGLQ